jgi:pyruvate dehydrogenase E2 component (dihydrolipoamide acetyltransferase)
MGNLRLRRKKKLSSFRKIAIGTWKQPKDCQVYGSMTLRMDKALEYLEEFRAKTGRRLTVTHLMCKAFGHVFEKMPDANAILRWNRIYLREEIALFFQVSFEDPETGQIDLSGITVRDPEKKSLLEIVDEFEIRAAKVRALKDKELESTRQTMKALPEWAVGWVMNLISLLSYGFNFKLPNIPRDAFGSAMISNVGSLGLEEAYAPLVPYSKVPIVITTSAIESAAVVDDGELAVGKIMRVFATFDHRVLDGRHAGIMSKTLKGALDDPWEFFGDIDEYAREVDGHTEEKALLEAPSEASVPSAEIP